jgi:hypothetical protein
VLGRKSSRQHFIETKGICVPGAGKLLDINSKKIVRKLTREK